MSKQVADVVTNNGGRWKHGHALTVCNDYSMSYVLVRLTCRNKTHPMSCAGAVAVQKVIAAENLLENGRQTGEYLGQLLRSRLLSSNALARPFTFDVRGGGSWWAVEFDFAGSEGKIGNLDTKQFAMVVQARCMENGLIVMGMPAGANLKESEGGHIMISPAYNITFQSSRHERSGEFSSHRRSSSATLTLTLTLTRSKHSQNSMAGSQL